MHKKYIAFYLSLPRDQHDHNISNSLDALAKSHSLRSWDVLLVTTYKYLCSRGLIMIKFSQERNSRWCVILFMSSWPKFWKYFCVSCLFLLEGHCEKKSQDTEIAVLFFFNLRNFDANVGKITHISLLSYIIEFYHIGDYLVLIYQRLRVIAAVQKYIYPISRSFESFACRSMVSGHLTLHFLLLLKHNFGL